MSAPPPPTRPNTPPRPAAGSPQAAPVRKPAGTKPRGKPVRKPARPRKPPLSARIAQRVRGFRFRLLPITIFMAVLMLGARVGDLWRLATREASLPEITTSLARNPGAPVQIAAATPATSPEKAAEADGKPPTPAAEPAAAESKPGDKSSPLGPISDQEIAKQVAERRAEIERRTKELDTREALLAAAEKRIEQKVQELERVRAEIQRLLKSGEEKQSAQIENLVSIYDKMKPKEAARIFDEMDLPQILEILPKMKDTKSSAILAAMLPTKVKEITAALLLRQTAPVLPTVPQ